MMENTSPVQENMVPLARQKSRSPSPHLPAPSPVLENVCLEDRQKSTCTSPCVETTSLVQVNSSSIAKQNIRSPSPKNKTSVVPKEEMICPERMQKQDSPKVQNNLNPSPDIININVFSPSPRSEDINPDSLQTASPGSARLSSQSNTNTPSQEVNSLSSSHPFSDVQPSKCLSPDLPEYQKSPDQSMASTEQDKISDPVLEYAERKFNNFSSPLHMFTLSPVRMLSPLLEINTGMFSIFRDSSPKPDSSVDSDEISPVRSITQDHFTDFKLAGSSPKLSLLKIAEEIGGTEDSEEECASGTVELEDFKPKLEEVESWEKDVTISHLICPSSVGLSYENRSNLDTADDSSVDMLPQVHSPKPKDQCSKLVTQDREKSKANEIVEAFRRRKRWDKPDEEYSLERTDNISSEASSESETSDSSHISIDCVSPKIAMMLPSLLKTATSQEFITSSDHMTAESSKSEEFSENSLEVEKTSSLSKWSVISLSETTKIPLNNDQQMLLLKSSEADYICSSSKESADTAEIMTLKCNMQPISPQLREDETVISGMYNHLQLYSAEDPSTLSPLTGSKQRHKKSPFSISHSEKGMMKVEKTSPAKVQPAALSIPLESSCIVPTDVSQRLESEVSNQEAEVSRVTKVSPIGSLSMTESLKSPSSSISLSPIKSKQSSPVFSIRSKARSLLKSPRKTAKISSATASEAEAGNISKTLSPMPPALTHLLVNKAQVPNLAPVESISPQQTSPSESFRHTFPTVVKSTSPSPLAWSQRSRSCRSRSRGHTPNTMESPLDLFLQTSTSPHPLSNKFAEALSPTIAPKQAPSSFTGEVNGKMTSDTARNVHPGPSLLTNSTLSVEHSELAPDIESMSYTIADKFPPNIKGFHESSPRITKSRYPSPVMCQSPLPLETTLPGELIQAAPTDYNEELLGTVEKLQHKACAHLSLSIKCESPSKPENSVSPVHSSGEIKVGVRHKPNKSPPGKIVSLTTAPSSFMRSPCSHLHSKTALSPLQDRSLAGLLASQRKKACSPQLSPQTSSARSLLTHLRSKGQTLGEPPAKRPTSFTPSEPSLSSPQPALLFSADNPVSSPAFNQHAALEVSSQTSRANSQSVSPSRHLVSAALLANGSAGLKNMLDKQRKASRTKKVPKEPIHVASNKSNEVALEHVTTSVGKIRVDRTGKPPSSVVTITQKKVRYTKEPIRGERDLPAEPVHDVPIIDARHHHQESKAFSHNPVFAPPMVSPDLSALASAVLSEAEARLAEENETNAQIPTNVSLRLKNIQSASAQQMRERELLIRKRLHAKKTKDLSKHGMPVKYETAHEKISDVSDTDIANGNLGSVSGQRELPLLKPSTLQQHTKGFSPKIASVSPPIKRRALDVNTDPLKSESSEFTDICNSSPIRRNKTSERYQAYPRTSPRNSPQAMTDRNNIPQAFGQQMQTFRHQQGLVGDTVELPNVLRPQERREEEPMDHDQGQGPDVFRTLNSCTPSRRPKKNRRVSWEDRQEGNPESDNSKNQNAYYSSGESGLEIIDTTKDVVLDRHSLSAGDDAQSHILSKQKETSDKRDRETNAGDQAHGDAGEVHLTLIGDVPQQDPRAVFLTKHVRNHKELVLQRHSGESNNWHALRNNNQLQANAGRGSVAVCLAKEERVVERKQFNQSCLRKEESHYKALTAINDATATTIAQKHTTSKQYAVQRQPAKQAVIKEERFQYIFKKNPRTAYFPEEKPQKECLTKKLGPPPAPKTYRRPKLPGGDENTNCPDNQASPVNESSFGHCHSDNDDYSALYMQQTEMGSKHPAFSPCADRRASKWTGNSCYQSKIYDTNGSANHSDHEGTGDICSPEKDCSKRDCKFFTPYPVIRESAGAYGCQLVTCLSRHEDNFSSAVCDPDLFVSSTQATFSSSQDPKCHGDTSIKSLYLSVPPEKQQLSYKGRRGRPHHLAAAIRYREEQNKHCGNKNNSGDVQPKSSPNLKQATLDNNPSVYRSVVEASACGGGDQVEAAGAKHHEQGDL